jgi:hypothetical protein
MIQEHEVECYENLDPSKFNSYVELRLKHEIEILEEQIEYANKMLFRLYLVQNEIFFNKNIDK